MIREFVEKFAERFQPGAPLEKWYPAWDAVENFILSSGVRTAGASHIRDGVDMQRIMVLVWFATFPAMFWGMYNVGWQANSALMENPGLLGDGLQAWIIGLLSGGDPASIWGLSGLRCGPLCADLRGDLSDRGVLGDPVCRGAAA